MPTLIVAPTSVVENWHNEFSRFAPHLNIVVLRSGNRENHWKDVKKADVVLISFALTVRDEVKLQKIIWDTVIVDEAQMVKNHQSKAFSVIKNLKRTSLFALSGTPMENHTLELWSIFHLSTP